MRNPTPVAALALTELHVGSKPMNKGTGRHGLGSRSERRVRLRKALMLSREALLKPCRIRKAAERPWTFGIEDQRQGPEGATNVKADDSARSDRVHRARALFRLNYLELSPLLRPKNTSALHCHHHAFISLCSRTLSSSWHVDYRRQDS